MSKKDYQALGLLLGAVKYPRGSVLILKEELTRAIVLDSFDVPIDSVGLNSEVHLEDLDRGEVETYVLTLPSKADPDRNRVSVLSPLGVALLGVRAGDLFEWYTPGGLRRLKVCEVCREQEKVKAQEPCGFSL